ncbi:hypothetical protein EGW08_004907 [Elysia chlorotica]|uniref:Uncharacterized protein n=1 Tax=Elysia chlorotica TaxID=188477 RepID=A0A433U0Q5_ELYCH|nr:hypothetical protein EGW08_004907 [Elysia chlorotica]
MKENVSNNYYGTDWINALESLASLLFSLFFIFSHYLCLSVCILLNPYCFFQEFVAIILCWFIWIFNEPFLCLLICEIFSCSFYSEVFYVYYSSSNEVPDSNIPNLCCRFHFLSQFSPGQQCLCNKPCSFWH